MLAAAAAVAAGQEGCLWRCSLHAPQRWAPTVTLPPATLQPRGHLEHRSAHVCVQQVPGRHLRHPDRRHRPHHLCQVSSGAVRPFLRCAPACCAAACLAAASACRLQGPLRPPASCLPRRPTGFISHLHPPATQQAPPSASNAPSGPSTPTRAQPPASTALLAPTALRLVRRKMLLSVATTAIAEVHRPPWLQAHCMSTWPTTSLPGPADLEPALPSLPTVGDPPAPHCPLPCQVPRARTPAAATPRPANMSPLMARPAQCPAPRALSSPWRGSRSAVGARLRAALCRREQAAHAARPGE